MKKTAPVVPFVLSSTLPSVAELLGPLYTAEFREAFPDVDPPYGVFGYNVLLQLRMPRKKVGSLILPDSEVDVERFRTQAALVRAIGPAAYTHRDTGVTWVEGAWVKAGDFVRAPLFGGDRFPVKTGTGSSKIETIFAFVKDADLIAPVTGNPLNIENS